MLARDEALARRQRDIRCRHIIVQIDKGMPSAMRQRQQRQPLLRRLFILRVRKLRCLAACEAA